MFTTPAAPRADDRLRVLLVDDDELYAECIGSFLGYEDGIEVVGYARDGCEGLTLAASLRPDVAVVDLEMPRMGGLEATSRIRSELEGAEVVVLSSSTAVDAPLRARLVGAAAYVQKSHAPEDLIPAILATGRRARSQGASSAHGPAPRG